MQNRYKSSKLCEEKQNLNTEKVSIFAAFRVSQMPKKYYKERGDVVDAVQSRRGKGLHLGKKVILILGYIFRNHSNFAH